MHIGADIYSFTRTIPILVCNEWYSAMAGTQWVQECLNDVSSLDVQYGPS